MCGGFLAGGGPKSPPPHPWPAPKRPILNWVKKQNEGLIKYIKFILKIKQSFKSEDQSIYTQIINKIALGPNDGKRIQSIESVATYANETNKDLMSEKRIS